MTTAISDKERNRKALIVLVVTGLLNLATALVKIIVGAWSGVLNVLADGLHSLTDSFVNVIGIVAIRVSGRPPSEKHPYGYYKYETLATLTVAGIMFILCYEVFVAGVETLLHPSSIEIHPITYWALVVSVALNLVTALYEGRMGRKLRRPFLVADARETFSDVFISMGLILAIFLIGRGWWWVDGVVSIAVSALIFRNALVVFKEATAVLVDQAVLNPAEVEAVVTSHPSVQWTHAIRSRGTEDAVYVDLHLGLDSTTSVEVAHDQVSHEVKQRLQDRFSNIRCVMIHVEPDSPTARDREHSVFRARDY